MADNDNIKRLLAGMESGDDERTAREFRDLYADAAPEFAPGFVDGVMDRLESNREASVVEFLPRMFKWVAAAGVAAAVTLLVMTYLSQESISLDALAGINEISLAEVSSLDI
ncbi:MAG: hypothetical protein AAGN35_04095 [Bacteroidota bacterium]